MTLEEQPSGIYRYSYGREEPTPMNPPVGPYQGSQSSTILETAKQELGKLMKLEVRAETAPLGLCGGPPWLHGGPRHFMLVLSCFVVVHVAS